MDYSVDACMNIFTQGQKDRIRTAITASPRRLAILSSPACCANSLVNLPIIEGFEPNETNDPVWTEHYSNSANRWDTTHVGKNSANSIFIDNALASLSDTSFLISPFLSLNGMKPGMTFDLAYAQGLNPGTDTLVISYSNGCNSWKRLISYYDTSLISTPIVTGNFIPTDSNWKKVTVDLSPMYNAHAGKIRFENHSAQRSRIYIDNINIYNIETSNVLAVNPYPNPVEDILSLQILFQGQRDITIELFDMLGQRLFSITDYNKTNYIKQINLANFTQGLYIVRVTGNGERVSKKILVKGN